MREELCTILENKPLAAGIYEMVLTCDTSEIAAPGQFVNIALPGKYLRRPISIASWREGEMTIVYKVVGSGTRDMAGMAPGTQFSALLPLGNGYRLSDIPDAAILAGGGVGVPPLYALCEALVRRGKHPAVYLGFNTEKDVIYKEKFEALGAPVFVKVGGYITDILPAGKYVLACGPEAMLRAIRKLASGGQYSLEARMACGFGACMGCSLETAEGAKRIYKDGPVFRQEVLLW